MTKTKKLKLTPGYIDALRAAEKDYEVEDTESGLRMIVRKSGVKTWALRYWLGKQEKLTIGGYPLVGLKTRSAMRAPP